MQRRDFNRLAGAALATAALPPSLHHLGGQARQELLVDGTRLLARLEQLARYGANEVGGLDRVAFSDADIDARAWVAELMRDAGLDVSVDVAGNLWGRRVGIEPELRPLVLGSHIDSVPGGGNFDGQLGSMAAVEVAWTLAEAERATRHPIHFVIFPNEEGGKTGSRALAGKVLPEELDIVTASGFTIGEGLARIGGSPERLAEAALGPDAIEGFLELHVEQGAELDRLGVDIGVVQGIVGIMRWNVTIEGETNHAGTTPMAQRHDALVAAARFIDMVYTTVRSWPGSQVATVGRVSVEPGAPNVIPGSVTLSLEVRDLDMDKIDEVFRQLEGRATEIGRGTGTTFSFARFYVSQAAPTAPRLQDLIDGTAQALGLSTRRMPSGAGHDAQSMAHLGPVGMIFVPSVKGVSHAPEEYTEPTDVTNGANVLLGTLLALDDEVGRR